MSKNIEIKISDAITLIKKNNLKLSITNICKTANISRQSLYNRPDLIEKIKNIKSKCNCHVLINSLEIENKKLKLELLTLNRSYFQF